MKVDPHLMVVKKLEVPTNQGQPRSPEKSQEGVITLISQENRRAWKNAPVSLSEAKQVLERISGDVKKTREETLAQVHHLNASCLLVLR